ncbi:putative beta DNA polymerase [Naematelia encephala]|uniref:DNA polymerase n=1 Tax=Naematelia encephala TaxID=71784 RepID=A0A1Y2BDI7_9TREE|nr:putative beta DNA polymerase [Naematelia encephala]
MPPRPSIASIQQSTSSSQQQHHRSLTLYPLFAGLSFHVVPAKLEEDMSRIYQCIDDLGGRNVSLADAKMVVTALVGRPRLARALSEWIDIKPIVSPEYIYDTFQTALESANAMEELLPILPNRQEYLVRTGPASSLKRRATALDEDSPPEVDGGSGIKRRRVDEIEGIKMIDYLPDMEPFQEDIKLKDIPKWCVERPSPLICINQDIINAIKPIYEYREYEELKQKNSNILSYRRSMSMLKSVPRRIRSGNEARKLLDVGEKVAQRIDEYLTTGRIAETESILASERYQTLKLFASVYTVGHHTARELYDTHHCRTLGHVRRYYQGIAEESEEVRLKEKLRRRMKGGMTRIDIVEEWMGLKEELDTSIPREEVEDIAKCVMEHLDAFLPGCQHTLTGGYRRGKTASNDVDIVFCPPEDGQDIGLLRDLYLRLSTLGIITHVLHVTHREAGSRVVASANNFDNLDKAFVIFKLPGKGRLHRRVDLISAPKERYAAAVLSWSGSMMFERDLRRYAEERGLKFKAGLVEPNTGREINLETEREIFYYLGLRYVPPELRNADG